MAKDKQDKPAPKPTGPRVCDPSDRATDGLKRFKLRLDGHPSGSRSQRYVLAADWDAARAEYLRAEAVAESEVDGQSVRVVVTELAD